jgi:hypothetical protein
MSSTTVQKTRTSLDWKIWFEWILANTVAETIELVSDLVIHTLKASNISNLCSNVYACWIMFVESERSCQ